MKTHDLTRAVRGLYYRQRLSLDIHRLENEVKSFLIINKLKQITVSSLKVQLVRNRLVITKIKTQDPRQLKLACVLERRVGNDCLAGKNPSNQSIGSS